MLVACLGDIMLDVIVDVPGGLVPDDDTSAHITFAAGGQAANVAGWVHEYDGQARLFGPRASEGPGRFVDEALEAAGIEVHGPVTGRAGTVVSLVSRGARSLASDPGTSAWLEEVRPGPWLDGADWLFVSGYALFRAPLPERLVDLAAAAHSAGTKVAVDLASAALINAHGPARFRELWQALRPDVVLANEHEWAATQGPGDMPPVAPPSSFGAGGTSVLVLKQGPKGCSFVIDGVADHRLPVPGPVRDVTGAGDALGAGFLLGGPELAMTAAARCVAQVGAQPSTLLPEQP
ncbi:MAG TPA: carbohydrate kinase family protein [Nocardioidaceae bacterium]|nr:carbohydrate kinase family protein [Nocardioidaceae bacterium]